MELVEVEIISQAITARYGTLNTGDILRTDAAFAKHLVDDCGAARYPKPRAALAPVTPEGKPSRKKRALPADADLQSTAALSAPEAPADAPVDLVAAESTQASL